MATQSVTMDLVMSDLSYLLGETSVPSPSPADRQRFIQAALERVYRQYDFDFSLTTATYALTLATGAFSLATNARVDPDLDIRVIGSGVGDDKIFTKIDYEQQDVYGPGDYRYWITGTPGSYVVSTTEANQPSLGTLTVRYSVDSPTINSSITTPFPSSMCLARGALVYYRQAEDPQADVSQLEALFQQELEEVIALQIRNQANRPAITRHQVMGTFPGDTEG